MLWIRTALFLVLVPGTVFGLVPAWLLASGWAHAVTLGAWRFLGVPLVVGGVILLLWCFADFVRRGQGTPAPIDPPKQLVTVGPYRWVRNPMYLAGGLILSGQAVLWEAPTLLGYIAGFWFVTHVFVIAYEEPKLARQFEEQYRTYREVVPRWIPRRPTTAARRRPLV